MLDRRYLRRNVPLPEDLSPDEIFNAMKATQDFFVMIRERASINLSEIIQANNFSGIVSNVFTKMLSDRTPYHLYSEQRYPDLMHVSRNIGLEVKASNKALKGGEGHNGHSGWHIVVCYTIMSNGDIEFIQAEIANLIGFEDNVHSDWKYQRSQRNSNNSQRTETYITTSVGTAKLRDGSLYLNSEEIEITGNMISKRYSLQEQLPVPSFSPFFRRD